MCLLCESVHVCKWVSVCVWEGGYVGVCLCVHVCVEGAKGEYLYECACPCEASEKVSFCMYVSVCIYLHVCLHVCVGGRSM